MKKPEKTAALPQASKQLSEPEREALIASLLAQYRSRPALGKQEQQARQQRVREANHIAACQGWQVSRFTQELDALYIAGQLTPQEQRQLFDLRYL